MDPTASVVSTALESILREDLNVDVGRVTRESRLIDDVGLDSVAFAVGMVAIEDKLGVALSEEDLLTCDTVGDLEAAILRKACRQMSELAAALVAGDVRIDERPGGASTAKQRRGTRHPWQEVHARAENVADRIARRRPGGAVGFVGEPTVEFVAAIHGAWLAGRRCRSCPARYAAPTIPPMGPSHR